MVSELPAIVVVAFNRKESLDRLFVSLLAASYPRDVEIPLVISLDFCSDRLIADAINEIVNNIKWPYGPKRIICREQQLGLKEHIIACGDLTQQYGSIILLEDDLFVASGYYFYSCDALKYYRLNNRISGISLYTHRTNPYLRSQFFPVHDKADVFFLQFASSWGQVWTSSQWQLFKDWYGSEKVVGVSDSLPEEVIGWPDSSWLKIFIKYMVETDRLFVYPRVSLSTNFGDTGTHFSVQDSFYQVPLQMTGTEWNFVDIDDSLAIYDAFFELTPQVLNKITPRFSSVGYSVDLYGTKNPEKVDTEFIITIQETSAYINSFGNRMHPELLNVVYDIPGNDIKFCKTADIVKSDYNSIEKDKESIGNKRFIIEVVKKMRKKVANLLEIAADIIKPCL